MSVPAPRGTAPCGPDTETGGAGAAHPLAAVVSPLQGLLSGLADACGDRIVLTDADGAVLWEEGAPEPPGPYPVARPRRPRTCVAAPIHDPETGSLLGAVDVHVDGTVHPALGRLVRAAAQLAEAHLRLRPPGELAHGPRQEPSAASGAPPGLLLLSLLRQERPTAVCDGTPVPLTLRRAELLTLLALHPEGQTADQLALLLYGDRGNATTVRAELHRLRAQLGPGTVTAKPYRLTPRVHADFLVAQAELRAGSVQAALATCRAPLLVASEAPGIRAERDRLLTALRGAVLVHSDLDVLWTYSRREFGHDDVEVFDRLVQELAADDPRRWIAAHELEHLLGTEGPLPRQPRPADGVAVPRRAHASSRSPSSSR